MGKAGFLVDANSLFISEPSVKPYNAPPPTPAPATAIPAAAGGGGGGGSSMMLSNWFGGSVTADADAAAMGAATGLHLGGNSFKAMRTLFLGGAGLLGGILLALLLRCCCCSGSGKGDDGQGNGVDLIEFDGERSYTYSPAHPSYQAGGGGGAPVAPRASPRHQYDVLDADTFDDFAQPTATDEYGDCEM